MRNRKKFKQESKNLRLCELFYAVRKTKGLQQTELAVVLEVTQGAISKIESQEDNNMLPNLFLFFKLIDRFDLDIIVLKEFIDGDSDVNPIDGFEELLIEEAKKYPLRTKRKRA